MLSEAAVCAPYSTTSKPEHIVRGVEDSVSGEALSEPVGMAKTERTLRKALLSTPWKDVLLIPQAWYPEDTPKYETQGWWYVPAEEVLGRTCKSCNAFCELVDFTTNGKKQFQ